MNHLPTYILFTLYLFPKNSNKTRHVTTATNILCISQNWVFERKSLSTQSMVLTPTQFVCLKFECDKILFKVQTYWILSYYLARFYWSIWTKKKLSSSNFPSFKPSTVQSRFSDIKSSDNLWVSDYFAKTIFQFATWNHSIWWHYAI